MKYIRINYVDAEPMKFGEFKAKFPMSGGANQLRPDEDKGYVITYRKGQPNEYVSWCPEKEFDQVSLLVPEHGMSFGMAIDACRYGNAKIQRRNWNGIGQYVEYRKCATLNEQGVEDNSKCFVFHFVNRNTGETGIQVGWLASQADLAASDWMIVE